MFESLRKKMGYRALKKVRQPHSAMRTISPLSEASSFQLLVPGDDTKVFEAVIRFAHQLREDERKVQVVVVNLSKTPSPQLLIRRDVVPILRKDVDFLYRPKEELKSSIVGVKPVYLIDFSLQPVLTLQHVTSLSKASVKIGFYDDDFNLFDITFAMPHDATFQDQLAVLEQYLEQLGGAQEEEASD